MLLDNEIEETYANQLVEELDGSVKPDMPIDYLLSVVYQKMVLKFGQTKTIQSGRKRAKACLLHRTDGVGKTTTIAKIASRLSVVEKEKDRASDSGYLPDRSGRAASYICQYSGSSVPDHLYAAGDQNCDRRLCGI